MSAPQASQNMNNILRLRGLSTRRKVTPGSEELNQLDAMEPDLSGTGEPTPQQNLPELEMGSELTPQSYDIRANKVIPPPQPPGMEPDQPGDIPFGRLGSALWNQAQVGTQQPVNPQTPPIETQQVEKQEGLPPVSASEQEASHEEPGVFQKLGSYLKNQFTPVSTEQFKENTKNFPPTDLLSVPPVLKNVSGAAGSGLPDTLAGPEKQNEWNKYNEDQALRESGVEPEQQRQQKQDEFMAEIESASKNPWQTTVYGSAATIAEDPDLQSKFTDITGVNYEPEIQEKLTSYESALKGVEDSLEGIQNSLGDQEEGIKKRILENKATDKDKYYIGLALALPLIIGGFFGKEAGLGALGGTAEGFANVLGNRQKGLKEDEAALLDISKAKSANVEKKADMELNKAKFGNELRKSVPENPREHLLGMKEREWTNPETGEKEMVVHIKPGFEARSEFVGSKEGKADMLKAANELSEVKKNVDLINDYTDDIIYITSQLGNQSNWTKGLINAIQGKAPGILSELTQDVEFKGRKVNAGSLLEQKIGQLANAYGQANQLGQLDRAAQQHVNKLFTNPLASFSNPRDATNQMLELRNTNQRALFSQFKDRGFVPDKIAKDYQMKNEALFGRLDKEVRGKREKEIMKKISRSGNDYAK